MKTPLFQTLETLSHSHNYNQWIVDNIQTYLKGDVLDIGSGLGDIPRLFQSTAISRITLSDKSEEMLLWLKSHFQQRINYKIIFYDTESTNPDNDIKPGSFDTITCINVLEHIRQDERALRNIHTALRPQGCLVLVVPALPWLYGSLDETVGHYRRYNKSHICSLLKQTGFCVEKIHYMNLAGVTTWCFAAKILKQRHFDLRSCQKLDRIVPLLKKLEKLLPPPLGQSLVVVGRKVTGTISWFFAGSGRK